MTRSSLTAIIRIAIVTTGLLLTVAGLATQVEAKPITVHQTISQVTQIQVDNCTDLGGTANVETVKGSMTNGHQVIKTTTTCTGGGLDGTTCVNTRGQTDCTQARLAPTATPDSTRTGNTQHMPVQQTAP